MIANIVTVLGGLTSKERHMHIIRNDLNPGVTGGALKLSTALRLMGACLLGQTLPYRNA